MPLLSPRIYRKRVPVNGVVFSSAVIPSIKSWRIPRNIGYALFLFVVFSPVLPAQTVVKFQPLLNGDVLELGDGLVTERSQSTGAKQVEVLRWYLSDIEFLRNGKVVFTPKKRHHLLDAEIPKSLDLQLATDTSLLYDELRFTLGVDSLTAASGAFGGDLDPTNGMYWTWRSGYINFKLEGTSPACPARKNRFQFHVGGFHGPFASQRKVSLAVTPAAVIRIDLDFDRFFKAVDLRKQYQVMSPNEASAELADLLAGVFRMHQE
ncbi:MAG: hypothetical protein ACI819_000217 [Neolewinella sp.]|jgi:hypothetical protein